jgi:DNA-3-methyladenine glycosylase I
VKEGGIDGQVRCPWGEKPEIYRRYHDGEWGMPVHDDLVHFEFLVLESAQAGLSWLTILNKREAYRKAYDGFDPRLVARFTAKRIERILSDPGIVRNRRKVESSVGNARKFLDVVGEFGSFDRYLWNFVDGRPVVNEWKRMTQVPAHTPLSDAVSADLKARGFKFVGTTIVYSHLQAVGVVNDHLVDCFRHGECARAASRHRSGS